MQTQNFSKTSVMYMEISQQNDYYLSFINVRYFWQTKVSFISPSASCHSAKGYFNICSVNQSCAYDSCNWWDWSFLRYDQSTSSASVLLFSVIKLRDPFRIRSVSIMWRYKSRLRAVLCHFRIPSVNSILKSDSFPRRFLWLKRILLRYLQSIIDGCMIHA